MTAEESANSRFGAMGMGQHGSGDKATQQWALGKEEVEILNPRFLNTQPKVPQHSTLSSMPPSTPTCDLGLKMHPLTPLQHAYPTPTCKCVFYTQKTSKCQNSKKYSRGRKSERDGSNQISTFWVVALQEFYQNPAVSGLL